MITKEITSLQHPIVGHLVKLKNQKDYRYEKNSVLISGKKQVLEIDTVLKTLLIEKDTPLPRGLKAEQIFVVTSAILKKVTGLENPEPIAAEVPLPSPSELDGAQYIIAIDGISDPGNLGTLLRTALALGWDGAFITTRSTDPFNDKALRAAKGATFRLPLRMGSWKELEELIKNNRLTPFVADVEGKPLSSQKKEERVLLVLGSESHGASKTAKEICKPITIPMSGKMESLNVAAAGAILMYSMRPLL